MKKIILGALLFFSFPFAWAEDNIAVFPFENKAGKYENIARQAESEMTSLLSGQKRFHVIERKKLNALLEEQQLSNSGLIDASETLLIGHIHGIRYGVFGQINTIEYISPKSALISLEIKITDMETGSVAFDKVYTGSPKDNTYKTADATLTHILRTLFKDDIAKDIINAFSIEGAIVDIDGKNIIIDVGSADGVVRGMEFNVIESKTRTSTRLNKGVTIQRAKALLEVKEVISPNTSRCKFIKGEKIFEGMRVKLAQVDDRYYKAEDIQKIIDKFGIRKGDFMISVYGGIGSKDKKNLNLTAPSTALPYQPGNYNTDEQADNSQVGLSAYYFVSDHIGLGLNVFNNFNNNYRWWWDTEDYGSVVCTGHGCVTAKRVENDNIGLLFTARYNINPAENLVFYIPVGLGTIRSSVELHTDRFHGGDLELDKQSSTEKETKYSLSAFVGAGVDFRLTNWLWVGLEGRYQYAQKTHVLGVPISKGGVLGLAKLSVKF